MHSWTLRDPFNQPIQVKMMTGLERAYSPIALSFYVSRYISLISALGLLMLKENKYECIPLGERFYHFILTENDTSHTEFQKQNNLSQKLRDKTKPLIVAITSNKTRPKKNN